MITKNNGNREDKFVSGSLGKKSRKHVAEIA